MKKRTFIIVLLLAVILAQAQEKQQKVWLGYMTSSHNNPSFINGPCKEMTQVSYNAKLENGKVVKGERIRFANSNYTTVYAKHVFDRSGKLVHKVVYNDNDKPIFNLLFNYEKNVLSQVFVLRHDTLVWQHIIESKNGKIQKINYYNSYLCQPSGYAIQTFNPEGFLTKRETFNPINETTYIHNWERDHKGRNIETEQINGKGEIIYAKKTDYGDHLEPIGSNTSANKGKKVPYKDTREYKWDDRGNWTKQIRYRNGKPDRITLRTYKFFEKRKAIELPEKLLEKYVGEYKVDDEMNLSVIIREGKMFTQATGQDEYEIVPYAKHKFFVKDFPAELEFQFGQNKKVTEVLIQQNGEFSAKKIK